VFRIKDRVFVVDSAFLFAEIRELTEARTMWGARNEGIAWFVEVRSKENIAGENDGWEPYAECICKFPRLPWQSIDGQVLEWDDSWDEEMGNQRSSLYLFDHCPIMNSRLEFSERRKTEFNLRWQGQCDLFWDEEYGENLELLIETKVQFIGIAVYKGDPSIARRMLSQFQNPSEFIQDSIPTYAKGSTTQFKPKLD
jgi:hypothetical protein